MESYLYTIIPYFANIFTAIGQLTNKEVYLQAEEIKVLNGLLEKDLDEATKEIFLKNQKLSEYAYMNAHHTRGPVARLLGLIKLVDTEQSKSEQKFILQKIKESIVDLDEVVRKMNKVLEEPDTLEK